MNVIGLNQSNRRPDLPTNNFESPLHPIKSNRGVCARQGRPKTCCAPRRIPTLASMATRGVPVAGLATWQDQQQQQQQQQLGDEAQAQAPAPGEVDEVGRTAAGFGLVCWWKGVIHHAHPPSSFNPTDRLTDWPPDSYPTHAPPKRRRRRRRPLPRPPTRSTGGSTRRSSCGRAPRGSWRRTRWWSPRTRRSRTGAAARAWRWTWRGRR